MDLAKPLMMWNPVNLNRYLNYNWILCRGRQNKNLVFAFLKQGLIIVEENSKSKKIINNMSKSSNVHTLSETTLWMKWLNFTIK